MDRVDLGIVRRDGLRDAGVRDFIYANKERGTTAGRSFDDPASHRKPSRSSERVLPSSRWRPIQGYRSNPCAGQVREGHSATG